MGGGHGGAPLPETAVQHHGGQREAFRHGGAGPVEAEKGDVLPPDGEGGGDALVQKVSGEDIVQRGGGLLGLVQGVLQRHSLHGALGLLKAGLAKGVVLIDEVKRGGQRPFPLLFAHHVGVAGDGGRVCEGHGLPAQFFRGHGISPMLQTGNSLNSFPQNIKRLFGRGRAGQKLENEV